MYTINLKNEDGENVVAVVDACSVSDAENQMLDEYNNACSVTAVKETRFAEVLEDECDDGDWYIVEVSVSDMDSEKTSVDKFLILAENTMQAQIYAGELTSGYVADTEIKSVKKTKISIVKTNKSKL